MKPPDVWQAKRWKKHSLYWGKNNFLFFFETAFLKNSELNIKKYFFCSLNAIDGMKHTVPVHVFNFHKEGEGKKTSENIDDSQQKNLRRWKQQKILSDRCMHIPTQTIIRYLENTCERRAASSPQTLHEVFASHVRKKLERTSHTQKSHAALAYTFTHIHTLFQWNDKSKATLP